MPDLILANDHCRAAFAAHGAELTSFAAAGREYVWAADPAVWGRHAPVLFPIVGRLPGDTYLHQGQAYTLGQHGFARDQAFAVLRHSATELAFRLTDSADTRANYPFAFALDITYTLRGTALAVRWDVRNPAGAPEELLFSIGAHPAFCCPLRPGQEQFEDYYFEFDHPVTLRRQLLRGGLRTGETAPVLHQQTALPLTYALFADDALVLAHYDFTRLALRAHGSPHFVRLRFDGFPYLGLWTKGPGAAFVCIEPWHGVASPVGPPQELRDKEGILTLGPGQGFAATYEIEIG
ncbi:aldose 1-epimerase family protein [Hymenobacter caeli]|uniref:Galactose mutarotase-like enzyme n=1 Tax=Hymenobacter caeli TaxID=2735894 RepID=A0ABX2FWN4_9BACT|nr:aldose 1-epimerase family protein [Hymenobacter caeli]NRT20807.1 galactose mutarotase-like enzyme [Hymenobacter caeli]